MIEIFDIHKRLGLNLENGLFIRKTVSSSDIAFKEMYEGKVDDFKPNFKVEYALKKLNPHSFFLFNNEPIILFFDKDFEEKITKEKLSEQIWNFNKSALAFVNYASELVIYNGFDFNRKSNLLAVIGDKLEKIEDLPDKYSYWQIVTAELWNSLDSKLKKRRVDKALLQNISTARSILIGTDKINKVNQKLDPEHANRIIARLIFVRYLIDRNVTFDYKGRGKELLTKSKLPELICQKEDLYDLFDYIANKFNGSLLPINGERKAVQPEHLAILSNLFAGNKISTKEQSLFNVFDFDFIPVEFISNIYETFLGEQQDTDKAFYTPPFLVDYVLEQTIKPYIEKINNVEDLSCKTVDFTCGSGIFLCETLRIIINRYIELEKPDKSSVEFKDKIKQLLADNIFGNDVNNEALEIAKFSLFVTLLDYFDNPKDIENFAFPDVKENFFNYDVFETELNSDNRFVGPIDNAFGNGKRIEPDFIIGNPPWGDVKKSKYKDHFIITEKSIEKLREIEIHSELLQSCLKLKNEVFYSKKEFESEIRMNCENDKLYKKFKSKIIKVAKREGYTIKRAKKENLRHTEIEISNNEFAQAFLLRLSDFSTPKTTCQVIVTSKLLYNLYADRFRWYFLNNFKINEVLEISSVRHQIFAGAVGPAAIIKYQYAFGKDTKENVIDYVSLKPNPYFAAFKSILIEKHDYKEVVQNELIKNDWLWKVLVYGHILDYRFIERLRNKEEFPINLGELIEERENDGRPLFARTGIMVGKKTNDISQYIGMYYINTDKNKTNNQKSHLQRFHIHYDSKNLWTLEKAEGARSEKVFKNPPMLLIKQGFTPNFKLVSSISYIQAIFTRSIYSISSNNKSNELIENLLGLICSDIMNYFIMLTCLSSINERDRLVNEELNEFPLIYNDNIAHKAKQLIVLKRLISILNHCYPKPDEKIAEYEKQFQDLETELNRLIFDLYNLSYTERDLISYAQEITIPILQAKQKDYADFDNDPRLFKPYKEVDKLEIENYINIFKEHFSKLHSGGDRGYFNVKIYQSKNILACEFSIDDEKREDEWVPLGSNERALELLGSLGFQNVSNGLFIQKDIKTLSRNTFSVAKPKQYKYWHKAIAHLDVIEFMEAMIESQKRVSNGKN